MNKTELTKMVAEILDISHSESIRYYNVFQSVLTSELEQRKPIKLQGFGSFLPWHQTERPGRNPHNGMPCVIQPRLSVKFKPGKGLLETINMKEDPAGDR